MLADQFIGHPEVLRHLPGVDEPLRQRLLVVDKQRASEILCLPLVAHGNVRVLAEPDVIAGMEEAVADGMGDHPASPLRVEPLGHGDNAVDLQLAEDLERPRVHLEPEADSHRLGIDAAAQPEVLPQRGAPLLRPVHPEPRGFPPAGHGARGSMSVPVKSGCTLTVHTVSAPSNSPMLTPPIGRPSSPPQCPRLRQPLAVRCSLRPVAPLEADRGHRARGRAGSRSPALRGCTE